MVHLQVQYVPSRWEALGLIPNTTREVKGMWGWGKIERKLCFSLWARGRVKCETPWRLPPWVLSPALSPVLSCARLASAVGRLGAPSLNQCPLPGGAEKPQLLRAQAARRPGPEVRGLPGGLTRKYKARRGPRGLKAGRCPGAGLRLPGHLGLCPPGPSRFSPRKSRRNPA